jgi:hypothetical protein
MVFSVGDLLVAWLLISPTGDREERRAEGALHCLMRYSAASPYRKPEVFGDALTDAMCPLFTTPSVLLHFALAGGLPALFRDCICSSFYDSISWIEKCVRYQQLLKTATSYKPLSLCPVTHERTRRPSLCWDYARSCRQGRS